MVLSLRGSTIAYQTHADVNGNSVNVQQLLNRLFLTPGRRALAILGLLLLICSSHNLVRA